MKKALFGRRSSAAGRKTFGGSAFGRQNSFDGKDMRSSQRESRGLEKKSMLLKPGFLAKKSISFDNLSAHDPKQWLSTVKKPLNPSKHVLVRSKTSLNITGINFVASTPCFTPDLNPKLSETNSYKKRRSSTGSRYSSYGVKNRKEVRPLTEKEFQQAAVNKIQNYFLTSDASHVLNNGVMKPMTNTMFIDMVGYLLHILDGNQVLNKRKYVEELPKIMKKYYYKGKVDKSWLITVNASHSFPQVVGLLLWLVELCETQSNFNVIESLYPSNFDLDEAENEDYSQKLEYKMYLPFLLNSYQVESRVSGYPFDVEFLQKQEELLLDNYKKIHAVDEEVLVKLESEVTEFNDELASLCDTSEEQTLEACKAMKSALHNDLSSIKECIKDLQNYAVEVQECISKKKDERSYQEKEIENLQRELNVVDGYLNEQQITQEDEKRFVEAMVSLKQDIQYEEDCLTEYSNIVYSEDLNVVNVRSKLDKLFVQYNTMCAENIVALPELENAIADKNVLAIHVRESLKEVDDILKCLKNKNSEKLKTEEQRLASVKMGLQSAMLEFSCLKKIADNVDLERDVDKKRLMEIADHLFEIKKENEHKLYELQAKHQAELKNNNIDKNEVIAKTEEKNNLCEIINAMDKEKENIYIRTRNSLKNHAKVIEETKEFSENLLQQEKEEIKRIKEKYQLN